jgi:hypothetical protein
MPQGVYDATKITPAKRESIATELAKGNGQLKTAALTHSSVHTVRVIADQEQDTIRARKASIAEDLLEFAARGSRKLRDSVDTMAPESLSIPVAVAIDKALLLMGEATSKVEVTHKLDVSALSTRLSAIPRMQVLDAVSNDKRLTDVTHDSSITDVQVVDPEQR